MCPRTRHLSDSFGITHYLEVFQGQRDQRCRQKLSLLNVLILYYSSRAPLCTAAAAAAAAPLLVVAVVVGFYDTSQIISVAFCIEREKSHKFCSEALISA